MKAITLHQPFAGLIVYGPKRIENRTWRPHYLSIGARLAIHAGMTNAAVSEKVEAHIYKVKPTDMKAAFTNGAILGDAEFAGVAHHADQLPEDQREWFIGPIAWILRDVRALPFPIPCKGAQGLWDIPYEALRELDEWSVRISTEAKR